MNMTRAEMRRVNADHSLDFFLVLVNVIRRATGDPDSLTIARDICPTLRADIQRKIATVCGGACSLDALVKLISNADAARQFA